MGGLSNSTNTRHGEVLICCWENPVCLWSLITCFMFVVRNIWETMRLFACSVLAQYSERGTHRDLKSLVCVNWDSSDH